VVRAAQELPRLIQDHQSFMLVEVAEVSALLKRYLILQALAVQVVVVQAVQLEATVLQALQILAVAVEVEQAQEDTLVAQAAQV
jgi:hypothetical protein